VIKRYDSDNGKSGLDGMTEWKGGDYVLYTDHAAELAKVNARLEVAVEALGLIECNDLNPKTSDITPLQRQMLMAKISREALAKLRGMK